MATPLSLQQYLQQNRKKHLIFDFDETILHLHLPWHEFKEEIRQVLIEVDQEMVDAYQGNLMIHLADQMIARYGSRLRERIMAISENFEVGRLQGVTLNTGIINFIKNHPSQYTYHIWSSNMYKTVSHLLEKHELTNFFGKIVTKDKVQRIKPQPHGFDLIYDQTSPKSDYLLIGDSDSDQGAARAAGIDFYKVTM